MKKIDIVKDIERYTGGAGFITRTALAKYMKMRKQGEIERLLENSTISRTDAEKNILYRTSPRK